MVQGACNLTPLHVVRLRETLLDFKRADDRNYNDKERPLQLADDLISALLAQLFDVEATVGTQAEGGCPPKGAEAPSTNTDDKMGVALQAFTDAKVLRLQADERLAEGDLAAIQHMRPAS